jgi:guanylate kinase
MDHTDIFKDVYSPKPLVILISGVSGGGKDSIICQLIARGLPVHFVVTTTSRQRRENEKESVDYHFVSINDFESMIQNGEFIEYARVYDDYKGVQRRHVKDSMDSGKDVLLRLDVQGVKRMKQIFPEAVSVFVIPASEEEWVQRLESRHSETAEKIQERLATGRDEIKQIDQFDYVVVNANGQLELAVDQLAAILNAEHHRVKHRICELK